MQLFRFFEQFLVFCYGVVDGCHNLPESDYQSPAHLYNGVCRDLLDLDQRLFLTQVRGHKAEAAEELVCVSAGWNTG